MKTCICCGCDKPLSDYYEHAKMADGHLNKCKECQKANSRTNREKNLAQHQAYDRARSNLPHRVDARAAYGTTATGTAALARAKSSYLQRHPDRRKANTAVRVAIRDGKLQRDPCWACGEVKVEGHHPDYSLPLDVIWLCKKHHQQLHNEHDEFVRSTT